MPVFEQNLIQRAEKADRVLVIDNDQYTLYDGHLISFVGNAESVRSILKDIERRKG